MENKNKIKREDITEVGNELFNDKDVRFVRIKVDFKDKSQIEFISGVKK